MIHSTFDYAPWYSIKCTILSEEMNYTKKQIFFLVANNYMKCLPFFLNFRMCLSSLVLSDTVSWFRCNKQILI